MAHVLSVAVHACPLQIFGLGEKYLWHFTTLLVKPFLAFFTFNHWSSFSFFTLTVNLYMSDLACRFSTSLSPSLSWKASSLPSLNLRTILISGTPACIPWYMDLHPLPGWGQLQLQIIRNLLHLLVFAHWQTCKSWSGLFKIYFKYMLFEFYPDLTRIVSPWDFVMTAIALWTQAGTRCNLGGAVLKISTTPSSLNLLDTQIQCRRDWSNTIWMNPCGLSSHLSAPSSTTVSLRPVCFGNILFIRLCDAWMTRSSSFCPFRIISMGLSSKCSSCIQFFAMLACPIKHQIKVGTYNYYACIHFLFTYRIGHTQYDIMKLLYVTHSAAMNLSDPLVWLTWQDWLVPPKCDSSIL